jgi:hypothetical protein
MYSAAKLILLLRIFAEVTAKVAMTVTMFGGKNNIHYFLKDKGSSSLVFFIRKKYERKDYYRACAKQIK